MQHSVKVYDLSTFTILDFPDKPACIVWLAGCNMRCPYCHNPDIVFGKNEKDFNEVLSFLKKRRRVLEGVVISGGEPTNDKNIFFICRKIKELGYEIKIDTNGSNPKTIKRLIEEKLVDFIALDFKASRKKYEKVTGKDFFEKTLESLKIINESEILFEVRTTVHTDLLDEKDIEEISEILKDIGCRGNYFIQNFVDSGKTLRKLPPQKRILDISSLNLSFNAGYRNF